MKIEDSVHLKGEILIQAVSLDGTVSTIVDDKNLIVSSGRNNLCNSLVGTSSSYISGVSFGTGGTIVGNSNVATSVSANETTLRTPIDGLQNNRDYLFTPRAEVFPSPRAVFSITVPASTLSGQSFVTLLNGKAISELALMLNTTPLSAFAIKRFPSISKSDTISLIINWTIYV